MSEPLPWFFFKVDRYTFRGAQKMKMLLIISSAFHFSGPLVGEVHIEKFYCFKHRKSFLTQPITRKQSIPTFAHNLECFWKFQMIPNIDSDEILLGNLRLDQAKG